MISAAAAATGSRKRRTRTTAGRNPTHSSNSGFMSELLSNEVLLEGSGVEIVFSTEEAAAEMGH